MNIVRLVMRTIGRLGPIEPDVPPGMKPWYGGGMPPIDWDKQGWAVRRNGSLALGLDWRHHQPGHHRYPSDIVAYTPK